MYYGMYCIETLAKLKSIKPFDQQLHSLCEVQVTEWWIDSPKRTNFEYTHTYITFTHSLNQFRTFSNTFLDYTHSYL